MDLKSTSLGSKEAVSSINNAFKNFVISSLHSGMCKKSKLRVYRELREDFECKKYLHVHGVSDMGSKLLFRFRSGNYGLNEELGRHSFRNSSKTCFFVSVSANLFYGNAQSIAVFVRNLLEILMGFNRMTFMHLKSSFDKTKI